MPSVECGFEDDGPVAGVDLLVAYGPTVQTDIGFDSTWRIGWPGKPVAGAEQVNALIDTGASISCIDNILAGQLGLPVVDRQKLAGIGGSYDADMYAAQIHIHELGFTIYGSFAGVDLMSGGQQHFALIGRTFLRRFTMIYNGMTGQVTIQN